MNDHLFSGDTFDDNQTQPESLGKRVCRRLRMRQWALKTAQPILSFLELREQRMGRAYTVWAAILRKFSSRLGRTLAKLTPARAKLHLQSVLARWGHKTLEDHAVAINKFLVWQHARWPEEEVQPRSPRPADLEDYVAVLVGIDSCVVRQW